jgi:hypothetical protein
MNFRAMILGVILPAVSLYARDKTDVLVMKNGDRMTCAVKGLERGVLYVDFDYIDGTASVDWSKVARLESKQLFLVRTEDGSVYTGTLSTPETAPGRPVEMHVVESPEHEAVIEPSQIVRIAATSEKFRQRFSGAVNWGVIYSKGNQSTQYSLGATAEYLRERWRAGAGFDSNLSSSSGVNVSTRNSVNLYSFRLLPWNQWFYGGLGNFLQSSEQGITLQTSIGGGLGRYLTNTNRASVAVMGGGAWQNTSYRRAAVPPNNQNLAAALIDVEGKLFRFSRTNLDANAAFFPALSDPGRLRFSTNVYYYVKLFSNLKWNISFYGNWDNRPPPGLSSSDYGSSSGLSWTFGLR